jgi:hypothetical protein
VNTLQGRHFVASLINDPGPACVLPKKAPALAEEYGAVIGPSFKLQTWREITNLQRTDQATFQQTNGGAMAQVVSRRPLTAEARVRVHVGFVVDKVVLGQVFLRVLRFSPVNISFHRRSPNSYHLGNA